MSDVLLVSLNGHGHFRPMMAFGQRLAKASSRLRPHLILVLPDYAKLPEAEYPDVKVMVIRPPPKISGPTDSQSRFGWMAEKRDEIVEQAVALASGLAPKAVIYDAAVNWGPPLARALGVKHFAFCSLPLYAYYLWKKGWIFCDELPASDGVCIPGLGKLRPTQLPTMRMDSAYMKEVQVLLHTMRSMITNDSPAQPGLEELIQAVKEEVLVDDPPCSTRGTCYPLGYANDFVKYVPPSSSPEMRWLDQQPSQSVVFVSFGSWVQLSPRNLVEFSEGLANTKLPFLWALRERKQQHRCDKADEQEQPECPTDSCGLPVGFKERVSDRALILPWVSQPAVLRHPAIRLFITHCGWNSLTEGVSLTPAPKGLLPCEGEQSINAAIAQDYWKIGRILWTEDPPDAKCDRTTVATRISELLLDESITGGARAFYERHREHTAKDADTILQNLVHDILA